MSARGFVLGVSVILWANVGHAQVVALDDNEDIGQVLRVIMPEADVYHIKNVSYPELRITPGDELPLAMFRKRIAMHSTHVLERAAILIFVARRAAQDKTADVKRTRFNYRAEWLADEPTLVGFPVAFGGLINRDSIRPIESTEGERVTAPVKLIGGTPMTVIVDAPAKGIDAFTEEQSPVIVGGMFFKRVSAKVASELGATDLGDQTVVPYVVLSELKPTGIEVDADLLNGIEHRTPLGDNEARSYFRLLLQAKLLSNSQLKKAASETAKTRLENHRELIVAHYQDLLSRAAALAKKAEELGEKGVEFANRAVEVRTDAENYRRQQDKLNRAWTARPEKYSAFLDSIVDPEYFAGRPVSVSGRVREVRKFPADSDIFGIGTLYEIWLFPEDGQSNPTVVVCTELPEGFPVEENVVENVNVTGYFLKLHAYKAGDTKRITPMILAKTVEWTPYIETPWPVWVMPAIIVAIVLVMFGLVFTIRSGSKGDRQFRRQIKETIDEEPEPDFTDLANAPTPTIGPSEEARSE